MTPNKKTVRNYMDAYNQADLAGVLACLTDDVEWVLPGAFHHKGQEGFSKEMDNPCFVSPPLIKVERLTEENDVVVAEGTVRTTLKEGGKVIDLAYCDVFEMRGGKIRKLISYLMELKPA